MSFCLPRFLEENVDAISGKHPQLRRSKEDKKKSLKVTWNVRYQVIQAVTFTNLRSLEVTFWQPLKGSKITIPRRSQSQKCQVSGRIIVFDVSFHSLKKMQTNPWKLVRSMWDNCFTHIEPRTFLRCWSSKCETLGGMSASNLRATNFTYFTCGELFATCFFQRRWRPNVIWRISPWRNTMGRWTEIKLSTRHSKSGTECSSDAQSQSLHRTDVTNVPRQALSLNVSSPRTLKFFGKNVSLVFEKAQGLQGCIFTAPFESCVQADEIFASSPRKCPQPTSSESPWSTATFPWSRGRDSHP